MRNVTAAYVAGIVGLAALAVILIAVSLGTGQTARADLRAELTRQDPFLFTAIASPPSTLQMKRGHEGLTYDQALDLRSRLGAAADMAMVGFPSESIGYIFPPGSGNHVPGVPYLTVDDRYFPMMGLPVKWGRTFTAEEVAGAQKVCVIGASRKDRGTHSDPKGDMTVPYTVVGQLSPVTGDAFPLPDIMTYRFPAVDDIVFTPVTAPTPSVRLPRDGEVIPLVKPRPEDASAIMEVVASYYRDLWPGWAVDFGIGSKVSVTLVQMEERVSSLVYYIVISLLLLVSISTAGLVMLFITQNKRSLALRRAVGATRGGIVSLCGLVGALLSAAGAGLGILCVVLTAPRLGLFLGQSFTVSWTAVAQASALIVCVALVASVAAGAVTTTAMPTEAIRRGTATQGRRSVDVRIPIAAVSMALGAATITLLLLTSRASLVSLTDYLRAVGERTVIVSQDPFLAGSLTDSDLLGLEQTSAIRQALPTGWVVTCVGTGRITCAAVPAGGQETVQVGGDATAVTGSTSAPLSSPELAFAYGLDMASGVEQLGFELDHVGALDWTNTRTPGVIVGTGLAERLFGDDDPIGRSLRTARGDVLQVTGVLKARPDGVIDRLGDRDWSLVLPYSVLATVADDPLDIGDAEIWLEFPEDVNASEAVAIAEQAVAGAHGDRLGLTTTAVAEEVAAAVQARRRMSAFQLGIAYAALLAAAWMVSATLHARVLERRREIGVKRVLGATLLRAGLEIAFQSGVLAIGAGLCGVVAGWAAAAQACRAENWPLPAALPAVARVFLVSASVGLLGAFWAGRGVVGREPLDSLREGE